MAKADPSTAHDRDPVEYVLDGGRLTLDALDAALGKRLRLTIADSVWRRIEDSSRAVQRIAAGEAAAYGINTGFGHLCTTRIPHGQLGRLQTNLILSHAVGVGGPTARNHCTRGRVGL